MSFNVKSQTSFGSLNSLLTLIAARHLHSKPPIKPIVNNGQRLTPPLTDILEKTIPDKNLIIDEPATFPSLFSKALDHLL